MAATLAVGLLAGLVAVSKGLTGAAAEEGRPIPAPEQDAGAAPGRAAIAVLAGGCFWGVQGVFQHLEGVTGAVSGYAGGDKASATYDRVGRGDTGHAEAVRVTYDPAKISYGRILQVFFSVAHDPTQLNRQGPDHGPQYRSAIFPADPEQARVAQAYIAQLDRAGSFPGRIATRIEPGKAFHRAEAYHQDFMARHPNHRYIVAYDAPKLDHLRRLFPDLYRGGPVLVGAPADD